MLEALDAEITATGRTVATIQPGAVAAFEGSSDGGTEALSADTGARAKFVEIKVAESTGVDLTKADVIVSGGRGVGDPEKFPEVIQPLADALGGAMGASRPVVDAGWLESRGRTRGRTYRPTELVERLELESPRLAREAAGPP